MIRQQAYDFVKEISKVENKNKYPGYELGDYAYEKERIKEEAIGEDICPVSRILSTYFLI